MRRIILILTSLSGFSSSLCAADTPNVTFFPGWIEVGKNAISVSGDFDEELLLRIIPGASIERSNGCDACFALTHPHFAIGFQLSLDEQTILSISGTGDVDDYGGVKIGSRMSEAIGADGYCTYTDFSVVCERDSRGVRYFAHGRCGDSTEEHRPGGKFEVTCEKVAGYLITQNHFANHYQFNTGRETPSHQNVVIAPPHKAEESTKLSSVASEFLKNNPVLNEEAIRNIYIGLMVNKKFLDECELRGFPFEVIAEEVVRRRNLIAEILEVRFGVDVKEEFSGRPTLAPGRSKADFLAYLSEVSVANANNYEVQRACRAALLMSDMVARF